MATHSGLASVRDDFRCSVCRQKNAFHCEHDTPYRDQLLGTYNQVTTTSRRDNHRTGSHVTNSASSYNATHTTSTGQSTNARHQQHGRIQENSAVSHTTINPVSYSHDGTYEQKKKKKTCVIL
jgi:hypothetical protein